MIKYRKLYDAAYKAWAHATMVGQYCLNCGGIGEPIPNKHHPLCFVADLEVVLGKDTVSNMMLDKNYKVPDGFVPILNYSNDKVNGEPVVGVARLVLNDGAIDFYIGDGTHIPALPLKAHGKLWHVGWDIPTVWAIDNNNQCWRDSAHGGYLSLCDTVEEMLDEAENEEDKNNLRKLLGLPEEEPEWMKRAREAGWTPPK